MPPYMVFFHLSGLCMPAEMNGTISETEILWRWINLSQNGRIIMNIIQFNGTLPLSMTGIPHMHKAYVLSLVKLLPVGSRF